MSSSIISVNFHSHPARGPGVDGVLPGARLGVALLAVHAQLLLAGEGAAARGAAVRRAVPPARILRERVRLRVLQWRRRVLAREHHSAAGLRVHVS